MSRKIVSELPLVLYSPMSKEVKLSVIFFSQVERSHPRVSSNTLVVLQEYLVQICLPIDTSHMSKQQNML